MMPRRFWLYSRDFSLHYALQSQHKARVTPQRNFLFRVSRLELGKQ